MTNDGFVERAVSHFDLALYGYDFLASAFFTTLLALFGPDPCSWSTNSLITAGTTVSGTLVAVTLTAVSILVSMSDRSAMIVLKRNGNYEKFLFTFEFSALIALCTAFVGASSFVFGQKGVILYLFIFLLIYTILAVATVISRVVTYGDKVVTKAALQETDSGDLAVTFVQESSDEESNSESPSDGGEEDD